eukprot:TRINITY_DN30336_c0_g1_i3.p2 TRINITY_DN30336_c0_g1~~TRINITY_DN30336_c0_g1_i3.p2  ORF type:complete len:155 (+),score=19.03 TRINITY_DN30336_c0_g1_i3:32-496(+)
MSSRLGHTQAIAAHVLRPVPGAGVVELEQLCTTQLSCRLECARLQPPHRNFVCPPSACRPTRGYSSVFCFFCAGSAEPDDAAAASASGSSSSSSSSAETISLHSAMLIFCGAASLSGPSGSELTNLSKRSWAFRKAVAVPTAPSFSTAVSMSSN